MINYSMMSDFDIQQEVLRANWGKHPTRLLGRCMLDITLSDYDPCKNPADAWPIIVENKINIEWGGNIATDLFGKVSANVCSVDGKVIAFDVDTDEYNPLRAAMICFLMIKSEETLTKSAN
ncbi:Protein of uncharacterised function (DUF2591) [Yersinia frederiksenii]|nr:Protein of uncharacterised function (DUF2591) [Yersinia frederiksenii]